MSDQNIIIDHRSVISVTGSEAITFLDRILTCRLSYLVDGTGRFGALLTPQGKILTDLFAYHAEDGLYLDLPTSRATDTLKRLTLLKLRADAKFELSEDLCIVIGKDRAHGAIASMSDTRYTTPKIRSILKCSDLTSEPRASDTAQYETERIASGLPECGLDYQENEVFPADVNMDLSGGIDFRKGCFVGQEVASRMKRKTEVRKRTLVLTAESENISSGAAVMAGESTLGEVTSWNGSRGLARIRIDRLNSAGEKGDTPHVDGTPVSCEMIIPEPESHA